MPVRRYQGSADAFAPASPPPPAVPWFDDGRPTPASRPAAYRPAESLLVLPPAASPWGWVGDEPARRPFGRTGERREEWDFVLLPTALPPPPPAVWGWAAERATPTEARRHRPDATDLLHPVAPPPAPPAGWEPGRSVVFAPHRPAGWWTEFGGQVVAFPPPPPPGVVVGGLVCGTPGLTPTVSGTATLTTAVAGVALMTPAVTGTADAEVC